MKRGFIFLILLCTILQGSCLFAQAKAEKKEAAKVEAPKPEKTDKMALKKAVKKKPNSDIIVGRVKTITDIQLYLPLSLDCYISHFLKNANFDGIEPRINRLKTKLKKDKLPLENILAEVNTAFGRQGLRLKEISPTEINIKNSIEDGVPLFWASYSDPNLMAHCMGKTNERRAAKSIEEWKKTLAKQDYDQEVKKGDNYTYYFILGYNPKSNEIGVALSPQEEYIFWMSLSEFKKFSAALWVAQW